MGVGEKQLWAADLAEPQTEPIVSKPFDPYHKWLAIPPKDQPPNHYRLLGIDLFESDMDVISNAADMRMTLVRSFQAGKHSNLSQQMLNEISTARLCLLNPEKREAYDANLRKEMPVPPVPPKPPTTVSSRPTTSPPAPDPGSTSTPTPSSASRSGQSPWRLPVDQKPAKETVPEVDSSLSERARSKEDPEWYGAATGGLAGAVRGIASLPRKADGLAKSIAGKDNTILLNFVRAVPVLVVLGVIAAAVLMSTGGMDHLLAGGTDTRPPDEDTGGGGIEVDPIPSDAPRALTNSIGMKLVLIRAGDFLMGSGAGERGDKDEFPQHKVELTKSFYMGMFEVTQAEYERVMGENPSRFANVRSGSAGQHPVDMVSWNDANEFCRRLSALPKEQDAGRKYRLPTEAEWEFACRAGAKTPYHMGKRLTSADGNVEPEDPDARKKRRETQAVGSYTPNIWGLFDMHGNVWEWCSDYYDPTYYAKSPRKNPKGPASGTERIVRGGGWRSQAAKCRAANRMNSEPDFHYSFFGFRVVCTPY